MGASQKVEAESHRKYATANHSSLPLADRVSGDQKIRQVAAAISGVDSFSHGVHFLPLLNFTLSNTTPNSASLTASQILTANTTAAILVCSSPSIMR